MKTEKPQYFLKLSSPLKFNTFKEKVLKLTDYQWEEWQERKTIVKQRDSLTIVFFSDPDYESSVFKNKIVNKNYVDTFTDELEEIFSIIKSQYEGGIPRRVMLVKLPPGKEVLEHTDGGHHLRTCHRIHLPIVTDKNVTFSVENTIIPMEEGTLIEINNNKPHSVKNNSTINRIHLIVDWGREIDFFYKER